MPQLTAPAEFQASFYYKDLLQAFGFTPEAVIDRVKKLLRKG
jgi:transketolase